MKMEKCSFSAADWLLYAIELQYDGVETNTSFRVCEADFV